MTQTRAPKLATKHGRSRFSRKQAAPIPLMDPQGPLVRSAVVYLAADIVGFLVSIATGSHVHLDLIGAGGFALVSLPVIRMQQQATKQYPHQYISAAAVSLWSVKLASFLFLRATRVGHDLRLENMLSTANGAFQFWGLTFLWKLLCSLPFLLGLHSTSCSQSFLRAGGFLYAVGLVLETAADAQKWWFKQTHDPGTFCNIGLWHYSQNPHYVGNLLLWIGILVMNIPALLDVGTPLSPAAAASTKNYHQGWLQWAWTRRKLWLGLISPLFMGLLFVGQVTGTSTNTMDLAMTKYGQDPNYKVYLETTAKMIPGIW